MIRSRKILSAILLLIHLWTVSGRFDIHNVLTENGGSTSLSLTDHGDASHCRHIPLAAAHECLLCPVCSSSIFFSATFFTLPGIDQTGILTIRNDCPFAVAHRTGLQYRRGPPPFAV
jgi:hypothetical protein